MYDVTPVRILREFVIVLFRYMEAIVEMSFGTGIFWGWMEKLGNLIYSIRIKYV